MRPNPVAARMMAAALVLPPALVLDVHASPAGENAVEPTIVVSSAANDQLLYFTSTSLLAASGAQEKTAVASVPEFFPLDNGVGRGAWTPTHQAACMQELGFDGIGYNYT